MSRVQVAMERAEKARAALTAAPLTETDFMIAETEWFAAQADLSIEVELALGVPTQRLAELLS